MKPTCSSQTPPKFSKRRFEQVIRLIPLKRSGDLFRDSKPLDLPDTVLGQLGSQGPACLRAFTPKDQKAVKTAAQTFRANPKLNVEKAITELGVGEALVSALDEKGSPTVVERACGSAPPRSRLNPPLSGRAPPDDRTFGPLWTL